MTGKNSMVLNKATVIAALQHYFTSIMFSPGQSPSVIDFDKTDYSSTFTVTVESGSDGANTPA